jgi:MFS transporter, DHA1 family, multidrug resistance protein
MSWKKSFFAILVSECFAIAGFATSMPIFPFYLQELGARSVGQVNFWNGLIQTGGSIALAVFSPIWGSLADHYGRKKMLLRAMSAGVVILGLMAFVTSPWQLFVLRVMQGCLTGTVAAATVLVSSTVPEEEIGFGLGLLQTFILIGASFGPLIGGVISDFFGYRATFLTTSVFLLISATIILVFVYEDFTPVKSSGRLLKNAVPQFGILKKIPALLPLFFIILTIQIAVNVISPVLPLYIQWLTPDVTILGTATGLILSISAVAGAVASTVIGKISDRFGYVRVLIICMIGAIVFYIPQGLVHNWIELLIFRVFGGIFIGGTMPAVNAIIAQSTPPDSRGTVFGLSSSFSSGGLAFGPAIGSVVAAIWGYRSTFFITACIMGFAAISLFFKKPKNVN